MIGMNGMTGIKGMTRMTRNDLTLDEWNDQDYLDDRDYQDEKHQNRVVCYSITGMASNMKKNENQENCITTV